MARSQWLEEAQRAGRGDSHSGERREPRFAWQRPLEIRVVLEGNQAEPRRATSRTLSDSGIGFTCAQPIEPAARIEVSLPGEPTGMPAVVRQCTETATGYLVGAEFLG
jgi:hypothetical protein